jgi:hypothetical protein
MKILFLVILLACTQFLSAQTSSAGMNGTQRRMETYSWAERPEENATSYDLQKMFVEQQWMPGIVSFKSGRPSMSVPVILDLHSNTLYYLQGAVIMEFVDTVSQFLIHVPSKKDSILMKFKTQLPTIQANGPETIYEVLVDGKVKLLKCRAKTIHLFKDRSIPEEKREEVKQLYFAELPGNKLVLIPMDADALKERLPDYSTAIGEIMKKEHIKLKNENKLAELFVNLNNSLN